MLRVAVQVITHEFKIRTLLWILYKKKNHYILSSFNLMQRS